MVAFDDFKTRLAAFQFSTGGALGKGEDLQRGLDPDQEGIKLHMCRPYAVSWDSSPFQQFSGGEMKGSQ